MLSHDRSYRDTIKCMDGHFLICSQCTSVDMVQACAKVAMKKQAVVVLAAIETISLQVRVSILELAMPITRKSATTGFSTQAIRSLIML